MDLEAGFRAAGARAGEPGSDPDLVARIRAEIERVGPLTFARFMELALYDPDHGYYRTAAIRPGRAGDFLTAPEAHPVFGWAVGRQIEDVWSLLGRPAPFVVREHGAGTGALAAAIVEGVARDAPALRRVLRYEPVEVDPHRDEQLRARLAARGDADVLDTPSDTPITGVVLANELLDALPVHRVVRRGDSLREVRVGWDGARFVDVETDSSTGALEARLAEEGVVLEDGQVGEICLELDRWVTTAAAGLARGVLLVIDYGATSAELYDHERRRRGTLLAYVGHRVHEDPYRNVGRQDLTAHVDLTALARAANAAGLVPLGSTTQAEFLVALGTEDLLRTIQADPRTTLADYVELRSALMRMLDPGVTGGFRVVAFGRGLPPDTTLRGFAFRVGR